MVVQNWFVMTTDLSSKFKLVKKDYLLSEREMKQDDVLLLQSNRLWMK